jgi:hypothetical protein
MRCPASSASKEVVTAALLVIGGKILSGCTKDQNVGYIAEYLTAVDIQSRWNFGNAEETSSRLARSVVVEGCDAARCLHDRITDRAVAGARAR